MDRILSVRHVVLAVLTMVSMGGAAAGLFDDDEARKAILDLRQKVQSLESRLADDSRRSEEDKSALRRSLIDLQNQLETLRSDMAQLQGKQEQMARDLAEVQRRQKDAAQSVDERLRRFEPSKVVLDGREFVAEPAEVRDFDAAMGIFRKGEFAVAQSALADFLNRYPKTGYRPSALFWLGNAQYATRDYKGALASFRALLASAADHLRASEAMLAVANCQLELKDVKGARRTLDELMANYPGTEAAQAAKDRQSRLK